MEKIGITQGLSFFKVQKSKAEKTQGTHSNPFGANFNTNVIQADVFQSQMKNSTKTSPFAIFNENLDKVKNSLNVQKENVVSFGKNITKGVSDAWKKANNIEISFDFSTLKNKISMINDKFKNFNMKDKLASVGNYISEKVSLLDAYSVERLKQKPVSELRDRLAKEIKVA